MSYIYSCSNEKYVIDSKLKSECLFLNQIYNNGYHLSYFNDLKSNHISKRTYAYLNDIYQGRQDNEFNLNEELIKHYAETRVIDDECIRKSRLTNEDLNKETVFRKSRIDFMLLSEMRGIKINKDRPRELDRRIDILFNEREAEIFDEMIERRMHRRERDLRNRKTTYTEEQISNMLKEYGLYRNIFYETAIFLDTARELFHCSNEEMRNIKLFKQENFEAFKAGRDRKAVRTVKFRICNQTLNILQSFNKDMNEKDLCKYIIYLTMFFHVMGEEDYMLITKIKDYANINFWLFVSEIMQ